MSRLFDKAQQALQLLIRGKMMLTFDQLPFYFQNVPFNKRLNFLVQGLQIVKRWRSGLGMPPILQIEPSNMCNLNCLTCATGAGLMKRPAVQMPYEMYRRVIDQVKEHVYLLVFWTWGEPFMNPDAFHMIRYAKEKGLLVHASTNGHFFNSKDQASKLIKSGLDSLIVALDGLDQQTYELYRRGGKLQTVIDSIENLVSERSLLGAKHPRITLRFMVMKHNEHQVANVKQFAQDLGVDAVTFRSAVMQRAGIDCEERLAPALSEFNRFNHKRFIAKTSWPGHANYKCHRPYANMTIFSNGDVVACENDFNAANRLGNIAHQEIREIFSSRKAKEFFKVFRTNPHHFTFCNECEHRYSGDQTANVKTYFLNQ